MPHYSRRERQLMNRWLPPSLIEDKKNKIYQMSMTWETLAAIREMWKPPLILKGVATADDAAVAVEHGVDVVYVSNHGGRALDYAQATIDVLPEIVKAVDRKAEIFIDGGFVRGSDVVKAICLGANAVGIGKLQGWALAAAGTAGLVRALDILEMEIRATMGNLGVANLDQLGPEYICKAQSVTSPHELSSFVHMTLSS
jgi:isopentenyl diphosphate isomerase/L-lactate dehydrogenase-like FMN-dependent dehydrogenase